MEATANLKDFWGNDAIDYGSDAEMTIKYADNIFVFVTDRPFGDGYVMFLCNEDEEDLAYSWLTSYDASMKSRNIGAYGSGVTWGYNVSCARNKAFLGEMCT
ncbi:MAG: hypothetical protein FWF81_01245 [Defluviitaleaceae bacterium]|nr:hypothetical protein [Defluviitaleaceae bacterium]